MQHSRIGRCAVSTRDLRNNTHARLVCVLFRRWHFCSVATCNYSYTYIALVLTLHALNNHYDDIIPVAIQWPLILCTQ